MDDRRGHDLCDTGTISIRSHQVKEDMSCGQIAEGFETINAVGKNITG